jgi:fibrillarin-like pre-rRNA processing protein
MNLKELFPGVYSIDGKIATKNLANGKKVYDEELISEKESEYRSWTPYRSKLSAAIMNGLKNFEIKAGGYVLYLGASTGTTASHVSDIVEKNGRVYCIEISERSMRDLINLCQARDNMLPILGNAHETEKYSKIVDECDVIYQDVSAKEQAQILKKNCAFLKSGGYAYFVIKSQSVDVSRPPKEVFESELKQLVDMFEIVERITLEPYDSAHLFVVLKKK